MRIFAHWFRQAEIVRLEDQLRQSMAARSGQTESKDYKTYRHGIQIAIERIATGGRSEEKRHAENLARLMAVTGKG